MEKNVIIAGLLMLAVGFGAGYAISSQIVTTENSAGMSMENSMSGMMHGLSGKTGDAFDRAFLVEMIVHHEGAVSMAEALLKNTMRPELQKLGNDIISAQTGEIGMMQSWLRDWYGE